jgi:hypothetical protein
VIGRTAALLGLALVAAVAWPLATYTVSLAAFGAAHVLVELRYVDARFGRRLGAPLRRTLALLLGAIVLGRIGRCTGAIASAHADAVELALGLALALTVVPRLVRAGRLRAGAALAIATGLALGVAISPMHALLVFAIVHNATPLGFLAEVTHGRARARTLATGALVFVAIPMVVATGLPWAALRELGLAAPELALLPAGPLEQHMRAYLPREALPSVWALHAFSAFTFMQCAHYFVVIAVLPRRLAPADRGVVPWPRRRAFATVVVLAGAIASVAFVGDFVGARAWYGVAAAVHAWVELPILLLCLAPAVDRAASTS